jgi:hypothetical protein
VKRIITTFLTSILLASTASAYWEDHDVRGQYMFGYAGVDADPFQSIPEIEANHIPTNVQLLVVKNAADNMKDQFEYLHTHGQRAVLLFDNLLFINDPNLPTPCGANAYRQRFDYKAKFDNWSAINRPYLTADYLAILVINSEINNRCISSDALDQVTQYVKAKLPELPTIAGYGRSFGAQPMSDTVPASLAGVAFFKYRIFDPQTDAEYQAEYNSLKAKLTDEQRIVLVPDGFYDSGHASLGWPKWYLGYVALNYMNLALNDPKVVGLVFFIWPSFMAGETKVLGSRELPQSVRDRQAQVGCGLRIQSPLSMYCN